MAGQSTFSSVGGVKSTISSLHSLGGITAMDTSAIGGSGRKGGAGEGPEIAPHKNICDEFLSSMGGEATTGTTGYNSGSGKTT